MLTGIDHLGLFIATGLLLNLTPGPDVLYIMTHSLKSGWRSGAVAALGITAGCFVHIAAAVLGLSAVLASSGSAFALLKWLGAAYLVYVGWGMLGLGRRATQSAAPMPQAHEVSATDLIAVDAYGIRAIGQNYLKKVFVNGFWTNALNPKVALFFLAFLPQFIAPEAPDKTLAFLWLGLLFNFNGLWVNLGYAALGAVVSQRVTALKHGMGWLERLAGTLFIGFGVKLALADHSPH